MSSHPPSDSDSPPNYSDSPPNDSYSPASDSDSPPPPTNSTSSKSSSPPPSPSASSPPPPSPTSSSPPPPSPSSSSPPPPSKSPPASNSSPPPSSHPSPSSSDNKSLPPSSQPPPSDDNNNGDPNPPPSDNVDNGGQGSHPPPRSGNANTPRTPQTPPALHPPSPPSPPSGGARALPPPTGDGSRASSDSSDGGGIGRGIIIGGALGGGLLLLIMVVCIVACSRRKKRKSHDQMNYYRDASRGKRNGDYYNGNWRNNNGLPPGDHMMKMPPGPASGPASAEHNWGMAPPPPPPMMSSSEMSSAGFSGPNNRNALPPPHPAAAFGFNQSNFTYDDLAAATGGFSQSNLLGQGGFGYVHKGVLPNGKEIAVKSLKANSGQGEREFQAEVDIISRVHHRHLVSLVGYCIAGSQRMLVYEFVPNGNLEYHLHESGLPTMDFPTRLKIALGSAKGFAYLHEDCHPRIIHRDIKAANILLDFNYEAMVADFGLAKLSSDNNTHVSTRIMGTFGYLAPEYASSGKLTEKSDVYSYGIMLLELISGRRPIDINSDDDGLVDWARRIISQMGEGGSYEELVDPKLENNYDPQEMLRMVHCAAACIRHSARRRPKMSQIVRALEGDVSLEDLNEGVKNGQSSLFGSSGSEFDSGSYPDMKRFRKVALSSQEFSSSEHGITGEFAHSSGGNSQELRTSPHTRI